MRPGLVDEVKIDKSATTQGDKRQRYNQVYNTVDFAH
jgi:hypothetical protein